MVLVPTFRHYITVLFKFSDSGVTESSFRGFYSSQHCHTIIPIMQPTKETETILNLLPIVKTGESSKYDVWYVKPDTSFFNQTRLRVGAINERYTMFSTICIRRQLCLYVFYKKLSWNGNTKCVRPVDS